MVQGIMTAISNYFGFWLENSPVVGGSAYPMFMVWLFLHIVVFVILFFGWRPLLRKLAPDVYSVVDYYFSQAINVVALVGLVVFTFYLGAMFEDTWGTFLQISGLVWMTLVMAGLLIGGRVVMGMIKKK